MPLTGFPSGLFSAPAAGMISQRDVYGPPLGHRRWRWSTGAFNKASGVPVPREAEWGATDPRELFQSRLESACLEGHFHSHFPVWLELDGGSVEEFESGWIGRPCGASSRSLTDKVSTLENGFNAWHIRRNAETRKALGGHFLMI